MARICIFWTAGKCAIAAVAEAGSVGASATMEILGIAVGSVLYRKLPPIWLFA
jgi:hypothetical protein